MKKTMHLLCGGHINTMILAAAMLISCASPAMDPHSHTAFTVDGTTIRYAVFSDSDTSEPSFHSVRAMNNIPHSNEVEIINVLSLGENDILVITRKLGLYLVQGLGASCRRIDSGLPPEVIYPFEEKGLTKPIVSHSVSRDRRHIAVIVPSELYLSSDGGRTFAKAPCRGIRRYTELLSVAIHPLNEKLIIMGTATSGIYYSTDGGATVRRIRGGIPGEPVRHPNFLEETRALCFGENEDTFYAGFGGGNGVYRGSLSRKTLTRVDDPALFTYPDGDPYRVTGLGFYHGRLFIATNRDWRKVIPVAPGAAPASKNLEDIFLNSEGLAVINSGDQALSTLKSYEATRKFRPDKRALGRRALYISYTFTQRENYPKLIKLLRHLKLNAVVMNLKDDYGTIRVPVTDPVITRVPRSVNPYVNVKDTIRRLHDDGIYVIARQVVFKDDKLYDYQEGKYAVKNRGGRPLRKGPEKWVDAHSEFVWDYNIAVARAIVDAGADEVQFDYIRFPDVRGESDSRKFDFQRPNQTMREALASFLKKARQELDVPISIDIFGYNAVYKWGNWIGQDIMELSQYVDAVSPMFYPSHYTGGYGGSYGDRRIYYIIYLSCKRAREITGGVHLRPYIQAFYYKDNWDNYCTDYIGWELDGLKKSGLSDWIFWNDLSEYTILIKGMRKYLGLGEGPVPDDIKKSIPKKLPFKSVVEKGDNSDS